VRALASDETLRFFDLIRPPIPYIKIIMLPKISLCLITKNEATVIERCLRSTRDLFDQIVIVDSSSTDETISLARNFQNTTCFQSSWKGDFSALRNFSFAQATGDLVMWMDADEVLSEQSRKTLLKLKERKTEEHADVYCSYRYYDFKDGLHINFYQSPRIYRRTKFKSWKFRVHEMTPLESYKKIELIDFPVYHYKPKNRFQANSEKCLKLLREVLKGEMENHEAKAHYSLSLAWEYGTTKNFKAAKKVALEYLNTFGGFPRHQISFLLGYIFFQEGDLKASKRFFLESIGGASDVPDTLNYLGIIERLGGDPEVAIQYHLKALSFRPTEVGYQRSFIDHFRFIPLLQLSILYEKLKLHGKKKLIFDELSKCRRGFVDDPDFPLYQN